jgi:hypothetical protein
MTNSKSIISYNGGSAGDLFTLSCNGETLQGLSKLRVVQPATLKDYEGLLQKGLPADLDDELLKIPYQFVNTHLLDEVMGPGFNVYNIVIDDTETQLWTVYRQMQLQKLRIIVNNDHIWFNMVKNYCLSEDYKAAAVYWFDSAKKLWLERMEYRIKFTKAKQLNFNKLYSESFVDSIVNQGWTHNVDLLKSNHTKWLIENNTFLYDRTIDSMSHKLATMDWTQSEGWIEYDPKVVDNK